jgi:ABC-type glycerol-3-phosphate transport system substrate-binding protein
VTTAQGSVFIIPAATKYPALAWEFLDWLTRAHAIGLFCKDIANLPPLVGLAKSPEFRKEPLFAFALDLARGEHSFGPPATPIWPRYKQEIARAEEYAVLGQQDPQKLLDDLQRTMTRELDRTLWEAL